MSVVRGAFQRDLTVRPAVASDENAVLQQLVEVQLAHHLLSPRRYVAPYAEALRGSVRQALADDQALVLIVEHSSHGVLGYAKLVFRSTPPNPFLTAQRWLQLDQIGVTAAWRRRGVADRLLDAVLQEARLRDLPQIRLGVLACNEPALEHYLKAGFVHVRHNMMLQVEPA